MGSSPRLDPAIPIEIRYGEDRPIGVLLRRCRLTLDDAQAPRTQTFGGGRIAIGAAKDNDFVIEDEASSRHHCIIHVEDGLYLLRDLRSTNGTYVDGVRVREAYLRNGATVMLGRTRLRFATLDELAPIEPSEVPRFGEVVGRSARMREIFSLLGFFVESETLLSIEGELGAGKEALARALHAASPHRRGSFVVLDGAQLTDELPTEEDRLLSAFAGSTVFLENVTRLEGSVQERLVRWLERPSAGVENGTSTSVRLVLASREPFVEARRAGRLREDLFLRIAPSCIRVPALRDRREDIPLLVRAFLGAGGANRATYGGRRVLSVSREALDRLVAYSWPGNVRELFQVLEQAIASTIGDAITTAEIPDYVVPDDRDDLDVDFASVFDDLPTERLERPDALQPPGPFKDEKEVWVSVFERKYIEKLLRANGGNISHASKQADIDRKYFRKLMRKHGIRSPVEADDS